MTPWMFVWKGLFPNLRKAQKRLKKLAERKRIKAIGYVNMPERGGREIVYARRNVKLDNLQHDTEISRLVLGIEADDVRRYQEASEVFNPDAEIVINGFCFYLEHDRDTMNCKALRRKVEKYKKLETGVILWVCLTEARMRKLMKLAAPVITKSAFALYAEVVQNAHAEIWRGANGKAAPLPRTKRTAGPTAKQGTGATA